MSTPTKTKNYSEWEWDYLIAAAMEEEEKNLAGIEWSPPIASRPSIQAPAVARRASDMEVDSDTEFEELDYRLAFHVHDIPKLEASCMEQKPHAKPPGQMITPRKLGFTSRKSKTVVERIDLDVPPPGYLPIAPNAIIVDIEKNLPPPVPMTLNEREGIKELLNMIAYQQRPQKVKEIIKYHYNGKETKITTTYRYTPMPAEKVGQEVEVKQVDSPKVGLKIDCNIPVERTVVGGKIDCNNPVERTVVGGKTKCSRTDNWRQTTILDAYGLPAKRNEPSTTD